MATTELIFPVIICGGAGSRLWLASRESFPKQFIALLGEESMFQKTLARVKGPLSAKPVIVTHADFRFLVASQLMQMGMQGDSSQPRSSEQHHGLCPSKSPRLNVNRANSLLAGNLRRKTCMLNLAGERV